MDKRRNETYNWYMLPMEERKSLMYNHGMIGRKYAGKIKQFITGSVGFDDFEWGVTLFSDDILQFKRLFMKCVLMKQLHVTENLAVSMLAIS